MCHYSLSIKDYNMMMIIIIIIFRRVGLAENLLSRPVPSSAVPEGKLNPVRSIDVNGPNLRFFYLLWVCY